MNKIQIHIESKNNIGSIKKLISFASQDITDFNIENNIITIDLADNADAEAVRYKVEKLIGKFFKESSSLEEIVVFENTIDKKYLTRDDIYNSNLIRNYGEGLISLQNNALNLYRYFDNIFKGFAFELGAVEKSYPTLLPMDAYKKTGYLKTSPQYSIFCCSPKEDIECLEHINSSIYSGTLLDTINQPEFALSPAACFHSYMELENSTVEKPCIITFNQNVFRHEGRFNWNDFGRLKDYHVREIVFFGDMEYVVHLRESVAKKTKQLIEDLNLNGRMCITFDPFVVPAMQKFKKIQIQEQSKYELQLSYTNNNYLAVSSFNLHGTAFTEPFNIYINGCPKPVTGCVGFGIERWVLAFLSQYGLDIKEWPQRVINSL